MEESGKRAAEFFGRLRREVVGFISAYAGYRAFQTALGRDAAGSDAAVGRLARTLGIATDRLSAYQGMAERVGSTKESLNGSFQSIQDQIEQFRLLGTPVSGAFRALGIQIADPKTGQARSNEDIYRDSIEALRKRSASERPTLARELGLGQEAVGFANLPTAEFNRLFEEQKRLGTVNERQAAAGQKLLEAWLALSQAFDTAFREIRTELTPAITALLKGLTDFVVWLAGPEFRPQLDRIGEGLRWIADYVGSEQMRSDFRAFGEGVAQIGRAVLHALRFFGLIPDADATPANGRPASTPSATDTPNALSPGIQGGIYRLREQVLGAFGVDVAVNRPEGTTGLAGGPAQRSAQDMPSNAQVAPGRRRTPEEFAREFGGMAQIAGDRLGVSPRIILGQMAIESDWGRAFTGRNNPFNMTAARGADATEGGDRDGNGNPIRQRFQNFATASDAAEHYAARVRRLWPGSVGAGDDPSKFAAGLRFGQQGGYASDPDGQYARWIAARAAQMPLSGVSNAPPRTGANGGEEPLRNPSLGPQSRLDPGLMSGARAAVASNGNRISTSTNSAETSIGQVVVNTQATDAKGIAQSIGDSLRQYAFVDQATRGLA